MFRCSFVFRMLTLSVLLPSTSAAQPADLPKAESLLDRHVEATGGKEAHEKLVSRLTEASVQMPAAGKAAEVITYQAPPAKMVVITRLARVGTIEDGTDGSVVWSRGERGPALKHGDEKRHFLRAAQFIPDVAWRELYTKAVTVGVEEVEGRPAYKVELTPTEGKLETAYFDRETGLKIKSVETFPGPGGDVATEILYGRYREVGGIKYPTRIVQTDLSDPARQAVITILKIEHDVELPADRFEVPDDVKPLLDKK